MLLKLVLKVIGPQVEFTLQCEFVYFQNNFHYRPTSIDKSCALYLAHCTVYMQISSSLMFCFCKEKRCLVRHANIHVYLKIAHDMSQRAAKSPQANKLRRKKNDDICWLGIKSIIIIVEPLIGLFSVSTCTKWLMVIPNH